MSSHNVRFSGFAARLQALNNTIPGVPESLRRLWGTAVDALSHDAEPSTRATAPHRLSDGFEAPAVLRTGVLLCVDGLKKSRS